MPKGSLGSLEFSLGWLLDTWMHIDHHYPDVSCRNALVYKQRTHFLRLAPLPARISHNSLQISLELPYVSRIIVIKKVLVMWEALGKLNGEPKLNLLLQHVNFINTNVAQINVCQGKQQLRSSQSGAISSLIWCHLFCFGWMEINFF